MVPSGATADYAGAGRVLIYTHGTTIDKNFDMASTSNGEAFLVMSMYAAQGLIVVAPNYTGYKGSSLPHHPYLNSEAQANDVIDAYRAARDSLASFGATASAKLFISSYSQGGHVAMATHKEIEAKYSNEIKLTASGPISGQYSLDKFGQLIYNGTVNGGASVFTPLLIDSYQNSYGYIYSKPSDVYQTPYDTIAVGLLPTTDATSITNFGYNKLPFDLFDLGKGAPFLIKSSYRTDFQTNANNGSRIAGKKNDLLGWKLVAPVGLCWGQNDPVVFGVNSQDSAASIKALDGNVTTFDLENPATTYLLTLRPGLMARKQRQVPISRTFTMVRSSPVSVTRLSASTSLINFNLVRI